MIVPSKKLLMKDEIKVNVALNQAKRRYFYSSFDTYCTVTIVKTSIRTLIFLQC